MGRSPSSKPPRPSPPTKTGLAECAAELDTPYKAQVEQALAAVEAVLAAEDPKTQTGDPANLKAATAALDESTKPLADLLMDKAMDAMLRQRGIICARHPEGIVSVSPGLPSQARLPWVCGGLKRVAR